MDKLTIDTYESMAQDYDEETVNFWEKFPRDFLDNFANSLVGEAVLDVGCGPGRDGALLRERGINVTCLDASAAMIRMCMGRGLSGVVADFADMPFGSEQFNGIWAYTSILHVPKNQAGNVLKEFNRVLRPNGVLGLGLIKGDEEGYRESAGVNKPRWFSCYQPLEVLNLLDEYGFQLQKYSTIQPVKSRYMHFLARKQQS